MFSLLSQCLGGMSIGRYRGSAEWGCFGDNASYIAESISKNPHFFPLATYKILWEKAGAPSSVCVYRISNANNAAPILTCSDCAHASSSINFIRRKLRERPFDFCKSPLRMTRFASSCCHFGTSDFPILILREYTSDCKKYKGIITKSEIKVQ